MEPRRDRIHGPTGRCWPSTAISDKLASACPGLHQLGQTRISSGRAPSWPHLQVLAERCPDAVTNASAIVSTVSARPSVSSNSFRFCFDTLQRSGLLHAGQTLAGTRAYKRVAKASHHETALHLLTRQQSHPHLTTPSQFDTAMDLFATSPSIGFATSDSEPATALPTDTDNGGSGSSGCVVA